MLFIVFSWLNLKKNGWENINPCSVNCYFSCCKATGTMYYWNGTFWFCSSWIRLSTGCLWVWTLKPDLSDFLTLWNKNLMRIQRMKNLAQVRAWLMHFKGRFDLNILGCKVKLLVQIRWLFKNKERETFWFQTQEEDSNLISNIYTCLRDIYRGKRTTKCVQILLKNDCQHFPEMLF